MLPGCGSAVVNGKGDGGDYGSVSGKKNPQNREGEIIHPKNSSLTVEKSRPKELREERLLGDVGDLPDLLRGALA